MTREEARIRLKNLKSDAELYDGKTFKLHLADSEIEALEMAISALSALEQIKAEQKALITTNSTTDYSNGVMNCLNIIDKYR